MDPNSETGQCPDCGPTTVYVDVFLCEACGAQHLLCEQCDRRLDNC